MSPKKRKDSFFDDLTRLFSRLPWWAGALGIAGTYAAVYYIAGRFSWAAPLKSTFGLLAAVAVSAAVVSAQFLKWRRADNAKAGSSIEGIRALSWRRFEELVQEAFRREGYRVEPTALGADGGVDLVLRRDGQTIFVQCKAWRSKQVGVERLRELFGVVAAEGADLGTVVTSGSFTKAARDFADGERLRLIDGPELAAMLAPVRQEMPPRVNPVSSSKACPTCGSKMLVRTARKGSRAGTQFLGCVRFPDCRGTRPL